MERVPRDTHIHRARERGTYEEDREGAVRGVRRKQDRTVSWGPEENKPQRGQRGGRDGNLVSGVRAYSGQSRGRNPVGGASCRSCPWQGADTSPPWRERGEGQCGLEKEGIGIWKNHC